MKNKCLINERSIGHYTIMSAPHGRRVYICSRLFEILAHAEILGLFRLFTLFFEEFDYTARVQHVLRGVIGKFVSFSDTEKSTDFK